MGRLCVIPPLLLTAGLLFFGSANAFGIDPFEGRAATADNDFAEHVGSAVHEMQTEAALRAIGSPSLQTKEVRCATQQLGENSARQNRNASAVIRGVRWPDDPNQLLPESSVKWFAWMYDGHKIAKDGVNYKGQRPSPWTDYFMNYRGHFGDMQHMHSMANGDGEGAADVRDRIIAWMRFLYGVSTCSIRPEAFISKLEISDQFSRKSGWTVHYLLNPSKEKRIRPSRIPEVATGALLHVVQDSFSAAHVHRIASATSRCPKGRVIRFNSYSRQSPLKHAKTDTREAWLAGGVVPEHTSVVKASAQVLIFIRNQSDWDSVVLPYLTDELFCLGYDSAKSSAGGYN